MRYLTERLPVMIAPRWVMTRSQSISIGDVHSYPFGALSLPAPSHVYEIGGRDVLVGSPRFLTDRGVDLTCLHVRVEALEGAGRTVIGIVRDKSALGVVAFQLFTGILPYDAPDVASLARAQGQAEIVRMQKTVTGLGSQMRVLVASVRRPADMAALAAQACPKMKKTK